MFMLTFCTYLRVMDVAVICTSIVGDLGTCRGAHMLSAGSKRRRAAGNGSVVIPEDQGKCSSVCRAERTNSDI